MLFTVTPALPTATRPPAAAVPEPTVTSALATDTPQAIIAPRVQPVAAPPGQHPLEALRGILRLLEVVLATVTGVLLVITLWMRRRQSAT
jgi:hypothetical protein